MRDKIRDCGFKQRRQPVRLARETARRELVTHRGHYFNAIPVYSYSTEYDLIGRPTNAVDSLSSARAWRYNRRSELVDATIGTNLYGYAYDSIGNRQWASANVVTNRYTANSLNQYTTILHSPFSILHLHDADGNLTSDGMFAYSYDAENRLVLVYPISPIAGSLAVENRYDHRHRRIRKVVCRYDGVDWQMAETHTFVWDGMNIVLEKIAFADNSTRTCEYFWGPDKSGTEQGAGGVGGLLAVSIEGQFYIPCYDHNGNIVCYVSEAGGIATQYLYDPYGNVIDECGAQRDAFAFGFSTKYRDRETNMLAYQRRFYRPALGRWLNRDPIEEEGSENLYVFCFNDAISEFDVEGCAVKTLADIERSYRAMIAEARKQGKNVAANNLEHFLSGNGEMLVLDWSWLRSDTTVIEAEKLNQERFEGKLVEKARTLADGESISFYDYFDAGKTASVFAELYYASGTFTVSSYGDFKLSRQGCIVKISGNVDHVWWDDYDWHPGLSAFIPGFGNVQDADAQRLEDAGMAHSFRMESEWTQAVTGQYKIRKYLWNTSSFSWGTPTAGNKGIHAKHGRSTSAAVGTGTGGGR